MHLYTWLAPKKTFFNALYAFVNPLQAFVHASRHNEILLLKNFTYGLLRSELEKLLSCLTVVV